MREVVQEVGQTRLLSYLWSTRMKYRKKPVVIEAEVFDGSYESCLKIGRWMGNLQVAWSANNKTLEIPTLDGIMTASPGDYIIRGIQGEFYPCKPDIFEKTYERVLE
jgi:hypothetical protein